MTNTAILSGRHVVLWLVATMTAVATLITDGAMVKSRTGESVGVVTHTAIRCRGNVASGFTGCKSTVMAGLAVTRNLICRMVKRPGYKTSGLVTHITILVSRHMIRVFARGGVAIVTVNTATVNILVIESGASKSRGVMAYAAILAIQRHMVGFGVGAGSVCTVMALVTALSGGYVVMVEYRRPRTTGNVT